MEPVKVGQQSKVQAVTHIALPRHVPIITDQQLEALLAKSKDARDADQCFRKKEQAGQLVTGHDVRELLSRAYDKGGKPKTEVAGVVAYYAQHKPRLFAPDAVPHIVEFIEKVDKAEWSRLVADLEQFIERLNQQRHEDQRQAELKKMRDKDDRDHTQRTKLDPQRQNGTKQEQQAQHLKTKAEKVERKRELQDMSEADMTDEITNGGRLNLSDVEAAQLALLKKGFANRD